MSVRSKPKFKCLSLIINKWTCLSLFDVQKVMFEFVLVRLNGLRPITTWKYSKVCLPTELVSSSSSPKLLITAIPFGWIALYRHLNPLYRNMASELNTTISSFEVEETVGDCVPQYFPIIVSFSLIFK